MKSTDGPISRYLNRKISMRITSFIISRKISLSPNQVSMISFFIALLTFPLYLFKLPALAGILVQLSSIIDGVDGELARALGKSSRKGGFFDTMLDRLSDVVMLFGASLYLWISNPSESVFVVSFFAVSGSILVSYLHSEGRRLFNIHPGLFGKIPVIASRDVRLFILFFFSIFDVVFYALLLISFLSYFYVIFKTSELFLRFEEKV